MLAERTGIAHGALRIIGSRDDYNATLATLKKICRALGVTPADLLGLIDDPPRAMRKAKKRKKRRG